jgi:stage III sporulation protein AA
LICAPPGGGKTTLIKDFILQVSTGVEAMRVAVVDSRGELCPDRQGTLIDLLDGYPRKQGLEIALRTMSPQVIVCDEVGEEDIGGILQICNAGVPLVASVHARDKGQLLTQRIGRTLLGTGAFRLLCFIRRSGGDFSLEMEEYLL